MTGLHPLLLVTFFPLVGAAVILLLKEEQKNAIRWTALLAALATFGLSLNVLAQFDSANPAMQLEVDLLWLTIGDLPIHLNMGVDGLNVLMVLLTAFLTPLAILSTWTAVVDKVKGFMIAFLLLEVGMMGVFVALDLVLFYIFWEFTLIPMYFLIGIWGGQRRVYAAVKFFLFTMAGSVLMLIAILFLGLTTGSFDVGFLATNRELFAGAQMWLFWAFALAFAIKVPMWPLHSWLPDAHVEAPSAGSVILAGVLLKMGTYGFLRFILPMFPEASVFYAPLFGWLAVVGILYGAIVAFAQTDVKKLVAYSSISHLGFVMLGIFSMTPQGLSGGILQMVNHGLSTGALFLIVGMLYERRHTRQLSDYGGLWKVVPVMGTLALITVLSSVGLPGLNGFIGEFTILLGAYGSVAFGSVAIAIAATVGVILAAAYLLIMFEKVFLGALRHEENRSLRDLNGREIAILAPILLLSFWIGLYPKPFFALINPTVVNLLSVVQEAAMRCVSGG